MNQATVSRTAEYSGLSTRLVFPPKPSGEARLYGGVANAVQEVQPKDHQVRDRTNVTAVVPNVVVQTCATGRRVLAHPILPNAGVRCED